MSHERHFEFLLPFSIRNFLRLTSCGRGIFQLSVQTRRILAQGTWKGKHLGVVDEAAEIAGDWVPSSRFYIQITT